MSDIQLHFGPVFRELCFQFLKDEIRGELDQNEVLYLVDSSKRADILRQQYLLSEHGSVAGSAPFVHKSKWLESLWDKLNLNGILRSNFEIELYIRKLIQSYRSQLNYYKYTETEFPASVLSEIFQYIYQLRLNPSLKSAPKNARWADIFDLFSLYARGLSADFLDKAEYLKKITQAISGAFWVQHLPSIKKIVWENGSDLNERTLSLLQKCADSGIAVAILFPYDQNELFFKHREPLFRKIQQLSNFKKLYPAQEKFYTTLFKLKQEKFNFNKKISIVKSSGIFTEIESAIGEILELNRKIPFHKIAVTYFDKQQYQPLVEANLRKHKIPFSQNIPPAISTNVIIQNMELWIKLVESNFHLDIIEELLVSPFFNYCDSSHLSEMIVILQGLRIRSGKSRILTYLKEIRKKNTSSSQEIAFEKLNTVLNQIFEQCAFLEKPATAVKIYRQFVQIIDKHQIPKRIIRPESPGLIVSKQGQINSLKTLMDALQKWSDYENRQRPTERIKFSEFAQIFRLICKRSSVSIKFPQDFGIQIVAPSSLSNLQFDYVYVLGMTESVMPSARETDTDPASILDQMIHKQISTDRELFLQLLSAGKKEIIFSYPAFSQSKPIYASPFLRELLRISNSNLNRDRNIFPVSSGDLLFEKIRQGQPPATFSEGSRSKFTHLSNLLSDRKNLENSSVFEGSFNLDRKITSYLQYKFKDAVYSVSQLETYSRCPFIYFMQRLTGISEPDIPDEQLTALDKGQILHDILFRFFTEIPKKLRTASKLKKIALEEFDKLHLPDSLVQNLEEIFVVGSDSQGGLLDAFLDLETDLQQQYLTEPLHFEFSFGMDLERQDLYDAESTPEPYIINDGKRDYQFKGKIDRIELSKDGHLIIVDYKTGQTPSFNELWQGKKLQLPIYLLAAEHFLSKKQKVEAAAGVYYQIKLPVQKKISFRNGFSDFSGGQKLSGAALPAKKYLINDKPASFNEFLEMTLQRAIDLITGIEAGHFEHTPDVKNCERCEYKSVCRANRQKQIFRFKNLPES